MKRFWKRENKKWEDIFHQNAEKSQLDLSNRESNPDSIDGAFYLCGPKDPDISLQTVYSYFLETAQIDFESNSEAFHHLFIKSCASLIDSLCRGRDTIMMVRYQLNGFRTDQLAKGQGGVQNKDSFTLVKYPCLFRGSRGADTELLEFWVEDEIRGAINDELTVYVLPNGSLEFAPREFYALQDFLKGTKPVVFIPPKDFCHSSLEIQIDLSEISYTALAAMAEEACRKVGKRLIVS